VAIDLALVFVQLNPRARGQVKPPTGDPERDGSEVTPYSGNGCWVFNGGHEQRLAATQSIELVPL
jgi:hypothetical protein